ncbi:energy transducer TonB [Terriglobus roseus]|nr:energy transducer TonB [Terriglobus roseus]
MKPALVHKKGLGVFTLRDVRQKNGYLEIDGSQKLYVRTEGTQTLSPTHGDSPVALAIYMASVPDMAKLVSTLKEELFYDSLQEAFAAVPVDQQPCIPLVYSPAKRAILPAPQCRTPTAASAPAPPHLTKNGGDTEIPPRVRDEAGQGQWMVTVAFTVNERGVPEAVHVAKPAFLIPNFKLSELAAKDLDESAVTAVKKYRFRPAMQDGKPVSFPLYVEVDFQIIDR